MFSSSFITFALMVVSASASCIHGTSFQRRQVSEEGKVQVSNFGYSGEQGPLNWAGLDAANAACRTATVQSPIVLDNNIDKAAEAPVVKIDNVEEAEFENLGTTLETIVNGTTSFAGVDFQLAQFHLHTPSEHRINEEYFPLEMHMVHEAADGTIAVIAVPFQLTEDGTTTELLTSVIENIDQVAEPGSVTKTGALDFTELVDAIQTRPLFQYTGSLTTPPCAEGLIFLVMEEPMALNVATYNKLKSTIKFNARYTQNTLGQTNLLDVATNLANKEAGVLANNATGNVDLVTSGVDHAALIELLTGKVSGSDVILTTVIQTQVTQAGGNATAEADAAKAEAEKAAAEQKAAGEAQAAEAKKSELKHAVRRSVSGLGSKRLQRRRF